MSWGSLTGVRPVKLVRQMLNVGMTAKEAAAAFSAAYGVSADKARLSADIALLQQEMLESVGAADICLYIGIPFCRTRCLYCSFVTAQTGTSTHLADDFVGALLKEIAAVGSLVRTMKYRIAAIYIGGGTPTFLQAAQLGAIIDCCKAHFDLCDLKEFTVEAGRPDTIDAQKLAVLKQSGVTRISINPQTMHDKTLQRIGRQHSANAVREAFALARDYGFDHINADVIAGLPDETPGDFKYTLGEVTALSPESITVHTLSIKRSSHLNAQRTDFALTDGDTAQEMVSYALKMLTQSDYLPYYLYRQKHMLGNLENIGYAKPHRACLYNVLMMEDLTTVISLGGGGVTKFLDPVSKRLTRCFNVKEPQSYIGRIDEMIMRKKILFGTGDVINADT